jgi:hypothetical protein
MLAGTFRYDPSAAGKPRPPQVSRSGHTSCDGARFELSLSSGSGALRDFTQPLGPPSLADFSSKTLTFWRVSEVMTAEVTSLRHCGQ